MREASSRWMDQQEFQSCRVVFKNKKEAGVTGTRINGVEGAEKVIERENSRSHKASVATVKDLRFDSEGCGRILQWF